MDGRGQRSAGDRWLRIRQTDRPTDERTDRRANRTSLVCRGDMDCSALLFWLSLCLAMKAGQLWTLGWTVGLEVRCCSVAVLVVGVLGHEGWLV